MGIVVALVSILIGVSLLLIWSAWGELKRQRKKPRYKRIPIFRKTRPDGRFNYSEGRYRRRLLAQSRRDYPGQSEAWHLKRIDELIREKKKNF